MTMAEIFLICASSYVISIGMDVYSTLNLIKYLFDRGYALDLRYINKAINSMDRINKKEKHINLLKYFNNLPIINILISFKAGMTIALETDELVKDLQERKCLNELTIFERSKYNNNPTMLNALLILAKRMNTDKYTQIEFDENIDLDSIKETNVETKEEDKPIEVTHELIHLDCGIGKEEAALDDETQNKLNELMLITEEKLKETDNNNWYMKDESDENEPNYYFYKKDDVKTLSKTKKNDKK